jgi:HEAT repeat protein
MLPRRRPNVHKLVERQDTEGLVKALGYRDHIIDRHDRVYDLGAQVRRDAALALASAPGANGVDPGAALIRLLGDRASAVRSAAATALSARRDQRATAALIEAALTWDDPRYEIARATAVDALIELDRAGSAAAFVTKLLEMTEGRPGAREILARIIDDGDDAARAAANVATAALSSGDPRLAERAAIVLTWLGPHGVGALIQALERQSAARMHAIRALGALRDVRATPPLVALLGDPDPHIREAVATALGELSDPRAAQPLVAAMEDSDQRVRQAALEATQKLRPLPMPPDSADPLAQPPAQAALRSPRLWAS